MLVLPVEILEDIVLNLRVPIKAHITAMSLNLAMASKIRLIREDQMNYDNVTPGLLNWWKTSGLLFPRSLYTDKCRNVYFLNWCRENDITLIHPYNVMNYASINGLVDVLEWWKTSGLKCSYTWDAIDNIDIKNLTQEQIISVLEWWKSSGFKLRYTSRIINRTSKYGLIRVLEWWKNSGLKLRYSVDAIDHASALGQVDVLEWWKHSGLDIRYTVLAVDYASNNGRINVLEWWKNSGLMFQYSFRSMEWARQEGRTSVIKWWEAYNK